MNRIFKISFWLLLFSGLVLQAGSQEKTIYFMDICPQNNSWNPAVQYDNTFISLNPSIDFSISNSTFTMNNLFRRVKRSGRDTLYWDLNSIEGKIRNTNYAFLNSSANLLFIGKKLNGRFYASFSVSGRSKSLVTYPGSIINFRKGNADLNSGKPREVELKDFTLEGFSGIEYSAGFSCRLNEKITLGMHMKFLSGLAGVHTERFEGNAVTNNDFSEIVLSTSSSIQASVPFLQTITDDKNKIEEIRSVKINKATDYLFFKNFGWALDLGGTYRISDKAVIYASLNDLGFLHWNNKSLHLKSEGEYTYKGIDLSLENLIDHEFSNKLDAVIDTLGNVFKPVQDEGSFNTALFAESFLGGAFRINNRFKLNGLIKFTYLGKVVPVDITCGAVFKTTKWLSVSGSWSYSHSSLYNFGLGLVASAKRFQFYLASDNINFIDLYHVRGINFSSGINVYLWQKKQVKDTNEIPLIRINK